MEIGMWWNNSDILKPKRSHPYIYERWKVRAAEGKRAPSSIQDPWGRIRACLTGPSKESQELLWHARQPFGQHAEEVSWLSGRSLTQTVPISGQEVGLAVVWHRAVCPDRFALCVYGLLASQTVRENIHFHCSKTTFLSKQLVFYELIS